LRVLIVSAESSSALYARRLLECWQKRKLKVDAFGIGDGAMERLGFRRLGRAEDMAVVGIKEVIKHFPLIRKVFHDLLDECDRARPDVALLLDYPDFNFRLAKKLKARGIRVIYYISPQLWAWRKSRIELVKKYVDKNLVLFPFEKDFYESHGVDAEFVGHPLLDEIDDGADYIRQRLELRRRIGVADHEILVGLMPGSRKSEIEHHLSLMLKTAEHLKGACAGVKFALPVAPGLDAEWLRRQLPEDTVPLVVLEDEPLRMVNLLDLALTASGTATLVLGLMGCPMVVAYRMKPFSAWIAKWLVKGVSYFAMVNLIFKRPVVEEFFQERATPEALAQSLSALINDTSRRRALRAELLTLRDLLGQRGATERVADAIAAVVGKGRT
jgi:lipid-A-disaccharide synthase